MCCLGLGIAKIVTKKTTEALGSGMQKKDREARNDSF